ncbi:hypothetical protein [Candidatus Spongiihabitans sp.]|uniref:hypothetical protein n=1 Tax=Candidatus Spongiihabitans sp. TaxID=3101308 RepID=UPI003C6F2EB8
MTGLMTRLWQKDLSLWSQTKCSGNSGSDSISNRLGWLDAVEWMEQHIGELSAWAQQTAESGKFDQVILLGMGGSSLAAEVFSAVFGSQSGYLQLLVVDTTSPAQINAIDVDLGRSLIIVASKSGSTVETSDLFAYFHSRLREYTNCPGDHLVAITDPNSRLHQQAIEMDFTAIFLNPADIGGRYSALSYFGLVPAALIGVNLNKLLTQTRIFSARCRSDDASNPVLQLANLMGRGALPGKNIVEKNILELRLARPLQSLAVWIEQLVAESTGKNAQGVLPVYAEPGINALNPGYNRSEHRFKHRSSVYIGLGGKQKEDNINAGIATKPPLRNTDRGASMQWQLGDRYDLGGEFLRWEMATALAASIMDINPFDQPDVEQAKQQTQAFVAGRESHTFSRLFENRNYTVYANSMAGQDHTVTTAQAVFDRFREISEGALYLAMLAYLPSFHDVNDRLQALRSGLAQRFALTTTLGYGPRYLHSTGQLHKGGPASGCFIQITEQCMEQIKIPMRQYGFADLHRAQADGDYVVLERKGRPLMRITLKGDRLGALDNLVAQIPTQI